MVKLREAIVVEGRYDKNTLSQIVDAPIFQTDGFGILRNKELLELLRKVAEVRGLIVFTDSDGAGFVIRNYLKGAISPEYLKHAYIPDVYGKEKRKAIAGKEGKLGVEGMTKEVILSSLRRAGGTFEGEESAACPKDITKTDLAELGLSGGKNSKAKRLALLKALDLPEHMSSNALLQTINILYSYEQLCELVKHLENQNG